MRSVPRVPAEGAELAAVQAGGHEGCILARATVNSRDTMARSMSDMGFYIYIYTLSNSNLENCRFLTGTEVSKGRTRFSKNNRVFEIACF